eukprot:13065025-Alexandrium_andersonii.AAC.1
MWTAAFAKSVKGRPARVRKSLSWSFITASWTNTRRSCSVGATHAGGGPRASSASRARAQSS